MSPQHYTTVSSSCLGILQPSWPQPQASNFPFQSRSCLSRFLNHDSKSKRSILFSLRSSFLLPSSFTLGHFPCHLNGFQISLEMFTSKYLMILPRILILGTCLLLALAKAKSTCLIGCLVQECKPAVDLSFDCDKSTEYYEWGQEEGIGQDGQKINKEIPESVFAGLFVEKASPALITLHTFWRYLEAKNPKMITFRCLIFFHFIY